LAASARTSLHVSKSIFYRHDADDHLQIVEEANDVGTAYLRIALLPEEARGPLQDKCREYVDSRLQTYRAGHDIVRGSQLLQQTAQQQSQIWKMAVEAIGHASSPPVAALILPSLNDMFDIALLFSLTLYVIIDMEYPRVGLIRVTATDRVLEDVRDSMRWAVRRRFAEDPLPGPRRSRIGTRADIV
jgi:hypothetical protein